MEEQIAMNQLCQLLKIALESQGLNAALPNSKLEADGINCCRLTSDDIQIELILDSRDHQITSTISFLTEPTGRHEAMQTHILQRLFDKSVVDDEQQVSTLDELVRNEIACAANLLNEANNLGYTARDLLLFYRGYNAGYTDSVSF
jgi:hypothetical protein